MNVNWIKWWLGLRNYENGKTLENNFREENKFFENQFPTPFTLFSLLFAIELISVKWPDLKEKSPSPFCDVEKFDWMDEMKYWIAHVAKIFIHTWSRSNKFEENLSQERLIIIERDIKIYFLEDGQITSSGSTLINRVKFLK